MTSFRPTPGINCNNYKVKRYLEVYSASLISQYMSDILITQLCLEVSLTVIVMKWSGKECLPTNIFLLLKLLTLEHALAK